LISGVAATIKEIAAAKVVTGVELEVACAFQTSVRAGRLVQILAGTSIADGLGGNPDPETITFAFIRQHVDQIVTVSEAALAASVVGLADAEHLIVEASGAAGVAAVLGKRIDTPDSRIVVIVTGSNIDRRRLTELLQKDG
jgi:threonine dehydratase